MTEDLNFRGIVKHEKFYKCIIILQQKKVERQAS